jgi:hypothetical protein
VRYRDSLPFVESGAAGELDFLGKAGWFHVAGGLRVGFILRGPA